MRLAWLAVPLVLGSARDLPAQMIGPSAPRVRTVSDIASRGRKAAAEACARQLTGASTAADTLQAQRCVRGYDRALVEILGEPAAEVQQPGVTLFNYLNTAFLDDRAYVASSVITGFINHARFELTYAQVVAADTADSDAPGSGKPTSKEIRDRVATVTRLVQNGGAATARVLFPLRPSVDGSHLEDTLGVFQRRANLYGDLGVLGLSDGDNNRRGALGVGGELALSWRVSSVEGGDDAAARVVLAFRGTSHLAFNGRVVSDAEQRTVNFGQALVAVEQNGVVSFGVAANAVDRAFREYVPKFSFVVSAARR